MDSGKAGRADACAECLEGAELGFDISMAFQPIVDTATGRIFANEALVRGVGGEPAGEILRNVHRGNRYRFDQTCRTTAIRLAAQLGMESHLSINFIPNAVYRPECCIEPTLEAAARHGFPVERIIFEITESEKVEDVPHLRRIVEHYHERGLRTAIDDFGAGYSGLNLLAEIQTDFIKLDMALIRNIDSRRTSQAIVRGVVQVCEELGTTVIAEGVETREELLTLQGMGIELFQGHWFAQPAFGCLPELSPQSRVRGMRHGTCGSRGFPLPIRGFTHGPRTAELIADEVRPARPAV